MRRLFVVLTVTFFVAVLLPGSSSVVGAQSNDCQMLGWTGLAILPESQLGWQGDVENVDGTPVRDLADVETFGWSPDGSRFAYVDAVGASRSGTARIATDALGTDGITIAGVGGTSSCGHRPVIVCSCRAAPTPRSRSST